MSGGAAHPAAPLATGYRHPGYAASFAAEGTVRHLASSGGWLIEHDIPGFDARDGRGPYPLFACQNWNGLREDLEQIGPDLVSVTLVTDPFGHYDEQLLTSTFDRVVPYKRHYVADLTKPRRAIVTRDRAHCAAMARKRGVVVEEIAEPPGWIDEWTALYNGALERFEVHGPAMTRASVLAQLALPGMVMLRAAVEHETVALGLFAVHGDVAYAHLVALGERAYELRASCALYLDAIERFAGRVGWIDWGGIAGAVDDPDDGLARFKRGWSTDQRTAFLCMRILNDARYAAIAAATGRAGSRYLPAYRAPLVD